MKVGEKIKHYREARRLSQQQLSAFSGVPLGTIKKYEIGNRNPKEEPLQKIASALGISLTALRDISLETIGDIAPYLFEIGEVGEIQFFGEKDKDNKFDVDTISISFKSPVLKCFLKEWADRKAVVDHLREEALKSPDETARDFLLNRAEEIEKEIKLYMIDSQQVVKRQKK